jgi:nitrite reductase/ring-hydroxylating ferredoxin subunit
LAEIKLCKPADVPTGELRQFTAGETEILVINSNGRYYCLAGRCTHAGAPLVEGELSGEVLVCPWHYSNFRITDGAVLKGPAEKPLKVYSGIVKENYLCIEI